MVTQNMRKQLVNYLATPQGKLYADSYIQFNKQISKKQTENMNKTRDTVQ